MIWRNKNLVHPPSDPDYDDIYDPEEDYERYMDAVEEREQFKRENQ